MDQPLLNIKDADMYEDVDFLDSKFVDVDHAMAVHFIKLKLLTDVRALRSS